MTNSSHDVTATRLKMNHLPPQRETDMATTPTPNIIETFTVGSTDALRVRAGLIPIEDAHPAARTYIERGRVLNGLRELFELRAEAASGGVTKPRYPEQLKTVLFKVLKEAADVRARSASEFRKVFTEVPVQNFKDIEIPSLDFVADLAPLPEGAIAEESILGAGTKRFKGVQTWARNWFVNGTYIINDDIELMAAYAANFGTAAAMRMARSATDFLESNPTTADSGPLFDVAKNSRIVDALSSTSLSAAMRTMRIAKMESGIECALPARFLVVEAGLEYDAGVLLRAAGLDTRIEIFVLPGLPTGRWYLLSDPKMVPIVGLLTLDGGINFGEVRDKKWRDGMLIGARADFNFVSLGRLGIVQGGP